MALSTKSPMPSLQQDKSSSHTNSVRATVTGVDSGGQLFRDGASVVYLKGQKCIYHSKFKPSPDSSVMIELQPAQGAKEAWRSNAKVKRVSPIRPQQDAFRVTVELDRAHSVVIDASDMEETLQDAEGVGPEDGVPCPVVPPFTVPKPVGDTNVASEKTKPNHEPALSAVPAPPATHKDAGPIPSGGVSAESPAKPAPTPTITPAPRMMVADIVRSVTASEFGQLRRELQIAISDQVEAALREPLQTLESKIEQHSRTRPAITEETVRQLAVQVAENVQLQWATTKLQKMVAEAVRQPLEAENERRERQLYAVVSSEVEAAVGGLVAARMDEMLEKALETKMEQHFRSRPAITEETVRQLAVQVAENVQLEWVSTKLQKMVAEAVRSALASDIEQRRREVAALVSSEIEAAMRGPVATRIDATLEKTLGTKMEQHFQTRPALAELQKMVAEAVRQPLEAEYEQRGRQVQAVVSSEIEAAVRGPVAAQMDEMLTKALEAQRAEYLRTPPPITEETMRKIVASVAEHPQFQGSIDALAANLSERWAEVARGATASAQQDVKSRIAATERLANQVVSDIQGKLDSFGVEMNRIFGGQQTGSAPSSPSGPQEADLHDREKRFREVLQTAGSQFEREMKAALQKIFGKS